MPSLFLLSPTVLDHSFPRSPRDLDMVSDALGEVEKWISSRHALLAVTDLMEEFLACFDWSSPGNHSRLVDVYKILAGLMLRGRSGVMRLRLHGVTLNYLHPLPQGVVATDVSLLWQEEAGKLLCEHQAKMKSGVWCIAVPCERAFSLGVLSTYGTSNDLPHFPLVGPDDIRDLEDAFSWAVLETEIRTPVSFAAAKKNLHLLGGQVASRPKGSHYKVEFEGARSWVLDRNDDPVPDAYLAQLPALCGYPIQVVKWALLNGKLPNYEFRFRAIVDR